MSERDVTYQFHPDLLACSTPVAPAVFRKRRPRRRLLAAASGIEQVPLVGPAPDLAGEPAIESVNARDVQEFVERV